MTANGRDDCLDLHGSLPDQNTKKHATVMLVGTPGAGKRGIARALLEIGTDIHLALRTTAKLPLSAPKEGTVRPRVDFIVLVIDMTSRQSFESAVSSCREIGVEFLLGRCVFIGTKFDVASRCSVSSNDILSVSNMFECPAMFVNLLDAPQIENLSRKLLTRVEVACGYRSHVSPALLETCSHYQVNSTDRAGTVA